MRRLVRDTGLLFQRSLMYTLRNLVWVVLGLFQPVLYLLLFAPLLNGLRAPTVTQSDALESFVPGLLVMMALFSTAFAGFNIIEDLQGGVLERLSVTPVSRLALLFGMILRDLLVFLIQGALLLLVGSLMGMSISPPGVFLLGGLMILIGTLVTSFSYGIALYLKDGTVLSIALTTITQPLLLLSGVLLPLTLAHGILHTLALLNPFAHAVDAARALTSGQISDPSIWQSFGIFALLTLFSTTWAMHIFRRAMA